MPRKALVETNEEIEELMHGGFMAIHPNHQTFKLIKAGPQTYLLISTVVWHAG